jgi:hypothetical protein
MRMRLMSVDEPAKVPQRLNSLHHVDEVRLTKRFAEFTDGIDVSRAKAGEVRDLSHEAALLILEGWAAPVDGNERGMTVFPERHEVEEKSLRSSQSRRNPRSPHKA